MLRINCSGQTILLFFLILILFFVVKQLQIRSAYQQQCLFNNCKMGREKVIRKCCTYRIQSIRMQPFREKLLSILCSCIATLLTHLPICTFSLHLQVLIQDPNGSFKALLRSQRSSHHIHYERHMHREARIVSSTGRHCHAELTVCT